MKECNLCGGHQFIDLPNRPNAQCTTCKGYERTRVVGLILEKRGILGPHSKVLHFAPEGALADYIEKIVGRENYHTKDIDPSRYRPGVQKFDLCKDVFDLPERYYDVIIHNHVIEHLPCNYAVVLQQLHRSLSSRGLHLFSMPIYGKDYDACFAELKDDERVRRFGQFDHVRRFGLNDLSATIGMVFRLPENYDLTAEFGHDVLDRAGLDRNVWTGFTGHTVFQMKKSDLLTGKTDKIANETVEAQPVRWWNRPAARLDYKRKSLPANH